MQGIYNYMPVTKYVSRVYSVAAFLYFQFVLHIMLFRTWNMFCTFTLVHYYYYYWPLGCCLNTLINKKWV